MMIMRTTNYTFAALAFMLSLLAGLVVGCAVAPQGADQSIASAYGVVSTVRTTAADLLTAKTITAADAQMVQGLADQARAALDLARGYTLAGKPTDAAGALTLATDVLTKLQTYLKAKGP